MSATVAGRFLSTSPSGKSLPMWLKGGLLSGLHCYLRQEGYYLDLWHMQRMFSQLYSIWFKHQFSFPSTCLPGAEENRVNKQRTDLSVWPNIYSSIGSQEPGCCNLFVKKTDPSGGCECLVDLWSPMKKMIKMPTHRTWHI